MVPRRTRRRSLIHLAGAAGLGALLPGRPATAAPLSEGDRARLDSGEVVRMPLDLDLPQGSYFGGVSYAVIHAPVEAVEAVLADPGTYPAILPMTLEARIVSRQGRDMHLYLRQGARLGSAAYVLLVRRESASLLRFWLDPTQPHEIADCWGYFRVLPWGKGAALLTYAALIRLDAGMVRFLFSEKIRQYALGTPGLVRAYVQDHPR
jgi:hypothetical protein